MSQLFASGAQSIGASASASVLPKSIQGWFPKMGWFYLLAVQETLKNLLQHHNSKASILRYSAFFMVQLSHSYMTTGKTIALTRWTFVGKVMSLLFNMLSSFVIAFLPRSKCLNFMAAVTIQQWFWSPRKWNLTVSTSPEIIIVNILSLLTDLAEIHHLSSIYEFFILLTMAYKN